MWKSIRSRTLLLYLVVIVAVVEGLSYHLLSAFHEPHSTLTVLHASLISISPQPSDVTTNISPILQRRKLRFKVVK